MDDIICAKSGRHFNNWDSLNDCRKSCENNNTCPYTNNSTTQSSTNIDSIQPTIDKPYFRGNSKLAYKLPSNHKEIKCLECDFDTYTFITSEKLKCRNCDKIYSIAEDLNV